MKTNNEMTARETLMLDALKEALQAISAQNNGTCIASVVSAIEMLDKKWIKKNFYSEEK